MKSFFTKLKDIAIRAFRAVRRFWRGSGRRMRVGILLLAITLVFSALYFTISAFIPPTSQSSYTAVDTLFGIYKRANIESVKLHTKKDGDYTIGRNNESVDVGGESVTSSVFRLIIDGKVHTWLDLDESTLSYLLVYTGQNNVSAPIISAPEKDDPDYEIKMTAYRRKLAEYKLDPATSPYYELTTVGGEVFRVYYGIATPNGGGYYVLLDGRDTIYASIENSECSIGGALDDGPEQFVSPALLFGSTNEYGFAFPNMFMQIDHERITLSGTPVTDGVRVGVTNRKEDGTSVSLVFSLDDEDCPAEVRAQLLGAVIGPCDMLFDVTYPDDYGEDDDEEAKKLRGTTVSYHFTSINFTETSRDVYAIAYVNPSERELYRPNYIYNFVGPDGMTRMLPNNNSFIGILENVMELTGEVVHIGLESDAITKYGLYRHTIAYSYPVTLVMDDSMNVLEKDPKNPKNVTEYWPSVLYISAETPDGTRYVGSSDFGIILEVEASALAFLEQDLIEMVEDSIFITPDVNVTDLSFLWNYGATAELAGTTKITCTVTEKQASPNSSPVTVLSGACATVNGKEMTLNIDDYAQFFLQMCYLTYREETSLSDEEISVLAKDSGSAILELSVTLTDNTTQVYRFIPVSSGRILVVSSPEHGVAMSGRFLIYASDFDAWTANFVRLMRGETVDHTVRH